MELLGNRGWFAPDPGTVSTAHCGVCGTQMLVRRNVFGATSWAEALGHRKHLHDRFICPQYPRAWHRRVANLMSSAMEETDRVTRKRILKKINEILKKHQ